MLNNIPLPNRKYIQACQNAFASSELSPQIECLIVHGSSIYKPFNHQFADIDFELILNYQKPRDYEIINSIIRLSSITIECQVRYLREICNSKGLILQSKYKIFMYYAYSNGITLIGKNIYKDLIKKLKNQSVEKSLLTSIQIYYKDIRKTYLANSHPYIVNKNIIRTLFDVCLYLKLIDYRELGTKKVFEQETNACVELIIDHFARVLNPPDVKLLRLFQNNYLQRKSSTFVFPVIDKIISNIPL